MPIKVICHYCGFLIYEFPESSQGKGGYISSKKLEPITIILSRIGYRCPKCLSLLTTVKKYDVHERPRKPITDDGDKTEVVRQ